MNTELNTMGVNALVITVRKLVDLCQSDDTEWIKQLRESQFQTVLVFDDPKFELDYEPLPDIGTEAHRHFEKQIAAGEFDPPAGKPIYRTFEHLPSHVQDAAYNILERLREVERETRLSFLFACVQTGGNHNNDGAILGFEQGILFAIAEELERRREQ